MNENAITVVEVPLRKRYRFMYENFLIGTQHDLYLFIEKNGETVDALRFEFAIFKYGSPNDEARAGHPLWRHGLSSYGLYEVRNSPWLEELIRMNRVHPKHTDDLFIGERHLIACFKDVMLEVVCRGMHEVQLSTHEVATLLSKELDFLSPKRR